MLQAAVHEKSRFNTDDFAARLKDRFRQFTHKSDPASAVDQPMT